MSTCCLPGPVPLTGAASESEQTPRPQCLHPSRDENKEGTPRMGSDAHRSYLGRTEAAFRVGTQAGPAAVLNSTSG